MNNLELAKLKEFESRALLAEGKFSESIKQINQLEAEIKSLERQLNQYKNKSNLKLKMGKYVDPSRQYE